MHTPSNGDDPNKPSRGDGVGREGRTEGGFLGGTSLAYRTVVFTVVAIGGAAFIAGGAGTFLALTGGIDGGEEFDVLGEYECEEFDGDPQVVHNADYEIERQVLSPSEVSDFDGTSTDNGVNVSLETEGVLLAASANEPDGEPITVDTDDDHVFIERNTTQPFRLWVDSVAEDGTVTRMQLDICPPQ